MFYIEETSIMNASLRLCSSLDQNHILQLVELYQNEWWTKDRVQADVELMLQNTDFIFAYLDNENNLAAFARVLSDHVYKAFIFDVIVKPSLRNSGTGSRILHDIISHPVLTEVKTIELYCRPELESFYHSFGFSTDLNDTSFMRRLRDPR